MKVVILLGSKSDVEYAGKIREKLSEYSLESEMRIASAHRTPKHLIDTIAAYNSEKIIYITVVGLSDALSGILAYNALGPVIACPPDLEEWKAIAEVRTPKDVPVALVEGPEKAAIFAAMIASLQNDGIKAKIREERRKKAESVIADDKEVNR